MVLFKQTILTIAKYPFVNNKNSTKQPRIGGGSHSAAVGKSCGPLPQAKTKKEVSTRYTVICYWSSCVTDTVIEFPAFFILHSYCTSVMSFVKNWVWTHFILSHSNALSNKFKGTVAREKLFN